MRVKHQSFFAVPALVLLLLYFFFAPHDANIPEASIGAQSPEISIGREPLLPLPPAPALPPQQVALGERLFRDPRLSHDNSISCASCHDLGKGGSDRSRYSVGIHGAVGNVNAPTVFNVGLNIAQFWDGRARTLEEQAAGPVHN